MDKYNTCMTYILTKKLPHKHHQYLDFAKRPKRLYSIKFLMFHFPFLSAAAKKQRFTKNNLQKMIHTKISA